MKSKLVCFCLLFIATLFSQVGFASAKEPYFCSLENFKKLERGNNIPSLDRAHVYQVGKLTLAGLGVGESPVQSVKALASQYGRFSPSEKHCTFYYNDGNPEAAAAFTWRYVKTPIFFNSASALAEEYEREIGPLFDQEATSFLSCAEKHNFIAMGCDGMRHRGPTVFGMLLSFAGCSPENSNKIIKHIWGSNHVPSGTREKIMSRAYKMGAERPASRARFQAMMGVK